ncbi:hypothetical protein LTR17_009481 [Elasticomyces elasticus]|nr:hypothetical protein LTR17_009481 [Elasticomyces elasticus]
MADPLSIIGLILQLLDTAKTYYDKVQDARRLPQAFREIYEQIDLVKSTFEEVKLRYKQSTDEDKVKGTLEKCEQDLASLTDIYKLVCETADAKWYSRYKDHVKSMAKGRKGRVEELWARILNGVETLESYHVFKNLATIEDINTALEKIEEVENSFGEQGGEGVTIHGSVANYHSGEGLNKSQNQLNLGQGTQFMGGTHTHVPAPLETLPAPCVIVPYRVDPDFVSREDLMSAIGTGMSKPGARIALVGLGGVGQLLVDYAYRARTHSPETWVLWIHASNAARFDESVRDIVTVARINGGDSPKANVLHLLWIWLRDKKNGKWLLVLDNADDVSFLHEKVRGKRRIDYLPPCDHGAIAITSRSKIEASKLQVAYSEMIMVGPMEPDVALTLLERKLGEQPDSQGLVELAAALDRMPLALSQAAAYMRQRGNRCSVSQYLHMLEADDATLLEDEPVYSQLDRDAPKSIYKTWRISFDHIRKVQPSAAELLSLMSFCDRQAIPQALLYERESKTMRLSDFVMGIVDSAWHMVQLGVCDTESYMLGIVALIAFVQICVNIYRQRRTSPERIAKINTDSKDTFDNDVALLIAYSFVTATAAQMFEMHRLVQAATQRWLSVSRTLDRWGSQYICNLNKILPYGDHENWDLCRALYPHVKAAMKVESRSRRVSLVFADMMFNAASYARQVSGLQDARDMLDLALRTKKQRLGDSHMETLDIMNGMLALYNELGQWNDAKVLGEQLVKMREATFGRDHPATLKVLGNLATTYKYQDRCDDARIMEEDVLRMRRAIFGHDDPDTLVTMRNLALTHKMQGKNSDAMVLEEEVLETQTRVLGRDNPDTLDSINNLGVTCKAMGELGRAESLYRELIARRTREVGVLHPLTLAAMNNLALLLDLLNRRDEAEILIAQVVAGFPKVLGDEHPMTLSCLGSSVTIYCGQKRYEKARKVASELLETKKRVFGESHSSTLLTKHSLALTLRALQRSEEAAALLTEAVEGRIRILGTDHPDTKESIKELENLRRDICDR